MSELLLPQQPNYEQVLFLLNTTATSAHKAGAYREAIMRATGLTSPDIETIDVRPSPEIFNDIITPEKKTLIAVHGGDGTAKDAVNALTGNTIMFLPGGNACNAARDTGTIRKFDSFFSKAQEKPLNILNYTFTDPNGDVIDTGIGLTCVNVGITGAASKKLHDNKSWLKKLGKARLPFEAAIAMKSAFAQNPFLITMADGLIRQVGSIDAFNSSYVAKNHIERRTDSVGLDTPNALIYGPELPNNKMFRYAQLLREMAGLALGYSSGTVHDISTTTSSRKLEYQIHSGVPVQAGVDGETRTHGGRELLLENGSSVSVYSQVASTKLLTAR